VPVGVYQVPTACVCVAKKNPPCLCWPRKQVMPPVVEGTVQRPGTMGYFEWTAVALGGVRPVHGRFENSMTIEYKRLTSTLGQQSSPYSTAMPKTPNRRLTYKERVQIWTLKEAGWKQKDIAIHLGIPPTTVSLCLRTPTMPAPPRGRPSKISPLLRILLVRHATENAEQRHKTLEEIAQELGISACRRTLRKAFEKGLCDRQKAIERPFLEEHEMERLR
jgi:hypothetical protein